MEAKFKNLIEPDSTKTSTELIKQVVASGNEFKFDDIINSINNLKEYDYISKILTPIKSNKNNFKAPTNKKEVLIKLRNKKIQLLREFINTIDKSTSLLLRNNKLKELNI